LRVSCSRLLSLQSVVLSSVENVAERLEPATLPAWAAVVVVVIVVVAVANASRWGIVSTPRELVELARRASDELLELPAIEPQTPARAAHVDHDSISFALLERGSFAARAVHEDLPSPPSWRRS
jgi:hypothetical protein